jgi:hypothetical protein
MTEPENEDPYGSIIDDEAVRMQMADLDETIQMHEQRWNGKVPVVRYQDFDLENSDINKRCKENQDLYQKYSKRLK